LQLPARAAKNLINNVAVKPGMSANVLLRNGHLANVIKGRDRFIREAVLEQDFRSGQVSEYHLSNVSRAAEELVESGKSDHPARNFKADGADSVTLLVDFDFKTSLKFSTSVFSF
jgi:hypothetical protein